MSSQSLGRGEYIVQPLHRPHTRSLTWAMKITRLVGKFGRCGIHLDCLIVLCKGFSKYSKLAETGLSNAHVLGSCMMTVSSGQSPLPHFISWR